MANNSTPGAAAIQMKLYCMAVLFKRPDGNADMLKAAHEVSSFGYFQRSR